jgi:SOS-response transcriptional repressor LexA
MADVPYPLMQRTQSVRLVSEVEAGGFRKIDNFGPSSELERIEVTVEIRRHTFALQVNGDSMCSAGAYSFPEGTIIVVEPDLEPVPGDFVVVLNERDEATFKQLYLKDDQLELRPLNEHYRSVLLGTSRIIGVVREAIRRFR